MRTLRSWRACAALALATLTAAGCGVAADGPIPHGSTSRLSGLLTAAGDASHPHHVDPAAQHGTIEFMTGASPVEQRILQRLIRRFESQYPGIHVHLTAINRDYPTVVLTRFAGGDAPDVLVVDGKFFSDWAAKGLLLPLDGYLTGNDIDLGSFQSRLLQAERGPGGYVMGLPQNYSTVALWTNDDMLRDHGIDHAPTTWDELEQDARTLTGHDVTGLCLVPTWERTVLFALQQDGGMVSEDGRRMRITEPATRRAVEWVVHMLRTHAAATPDSVGASWCGDAFGKRKAAMALEGAWMLPPMHNQYPDVHWSVHPLPAGVRHATLAYSGNLAISSASRHPDASWLLLDFLVSPGAQRKLAEVGLAVPSRVGVPYPPTLKPFADGIDYATVWSLPPGFFNTVLITADNEMSAVLEHKQTVAGMLAATDRIGRRMLEGQQQ